LRGVEETHALLIIIFMGIDRSDTSIGQKSPCT
jgi:hypothetical protein